MDHKEAKAELEAFFGRFKGVEVVEGASHPDNVSLFLRVKADSTTWSRLVEALLVKESQSGARAKMMICKRYMLRGGSFGFLWQVYIWSPSFASFLRDLIGWQEPEDRSGEMSEEEKRKLISKGEFPHPKPGDYSHQPKKTITQAPIRKAAIPQRGEDMVKGGDGVLRPSTKGVQSTPWGGAR